MVWSSLIRGFGGVTVMWWIGGWETVIVAVPLAVPDRAVIVALPTATPVTTPEFETVAIAELLVDHETEAFTMMFELPSRTVALSVVELPTGTVAVEGATVTDAAGALLTVTDAVPLTPSLVAVIVAVPLETPVTTPLAFTVAAAVLLLLQPTIRPVSVLPDASRVVAVRVTVCPTTVWAVDGVTCTAATGTARTVTVAEACFPSMDAMMTALPGARPVTTPALDTLANDGELLDQNTVLPPRGWPLTFRAIAVSCVLPPMRMLAVDGVISTAATGSGATVIVAFPVAPSLVAVIVAVPVPAAVTRPCVETVATAVLLDANMTCFPVNT